MSIHGPGDQTTSDKAIPFHSSIYPSGNKNLLSLALSGIILGLGGIRGMDRLKGSHTVIF